MRAPRQGRPLLSELRNWLDVTLPRLSRRSDLAVAIRYALARWRAPVRCIDDGRLEIDNNAGERALRGVAIGRKNWLIAGSDRGGHRAAAIFSLIETAKLNHVDPQAWLADTIARIADHPARRTDELLPWNYRSACRTLTLLSPHNRNRSLLRGVRRAHWTNEERRTTALTDLASMRPG
jgi:transposase